jgi:glycosyltransferase involved in cell wall biosynthesis
VETILIWIHMIENFGFNVIGHVSGNLGLGVSARNVIQMLLDNHFPVAVFDVDPGLGRGRHDLRFESVTVSTLDALPYAINLLIFPPPSLVSFVPDNRSFFTNPDRLNAAFIWWELPVIPSSWRPMLEFFDVLVAPSAFIRQTLDIGLSQTMTVAARQPLYLPRQVSENRYRFGLEVADTVYVTSFEPASVAMRKNVLAVVAAFERGLANFLETRLIVKLNNAASAPARDPVIHALREAGARDSRIRIITQPLDYHEVLCLYASSDVFVSLHRSEGLGLGPMEAMALGKTCIATAWSGNMDYMDHTNAALIPYKLVPVIGATGAYSAAALAGTGAKWAEPDVDEAAAWMKRLAENRALRMAMGARAADTIARFQEEAIKGRFAFEIRALWEHLRHTGRAPTLKSRVDAAFSAWVAGKPPGTRAMARLRRATSQLLDRHLLWRFRDP